MLCIYNLLKLIVVSSGLNLTKLKGASILCIVIFFIQFIPTCFGEKRFELHCISVRILDSFIVASGSGFKNVFFHLLT